MPPHKSKIGLIILAAGSSSRMNGKLKQLLVFRGKTLLRRAAETAVKSDFDTVVVVLGANAEKLIDEVIDLPLQIAINKKWQDGMGSSINTGITVISEKNLDAVIIMVCDQPLITTKTLRKLEEIFAQSGKPIVACEYEETIGVPALFSSQLFDELINLKRLEGAKKIIKKYLENTILVATPEARIDIDTIEDYEKFKQFS
ncbi:MAG: nucleotidyltransferase family protein [Acidobacteria bacterium]|nr:nucleotidyltransferase family protein [Acidobacteriota bacterium]MCA1639020.1 nucleotidyltransferase family protein [Acidobacteriota bacterium]